MRQLEEEIVAGDAALKVVAETLYLMIEKASSWSDGPSHRRYVYSSLLEYANRHRLLSDRRNTAQMIRNSGTIST